MDYSLMGERVRKTRKALGLTIEEFSVRVGVSPSFLGNVERGTRVASIDTLEKICKQANCSSDQLLGLSDNATMTMFPDKSTDEQRRIASAMIQAVIDSLNT